VLDEPALMSDAVGTGYYEAVFHVADWYRAAGVALPALPFLDVVTYRFAVGDLAAHYHLPMKLTPWGYSCFRGGA
jgi:5-hydroxyisourate hydrolase